MTGSGSVGGGPAAGRAHQSAATGNQNGTDWTLPEPRGKKVRCYFNCIVYRKSEPQSAVGHI